MSTEENKAIWRRWVEEMNKGKAAALAAMDEIFATDFVAHGALGDFDLENYKQHGIEYWDAFPDIHATIDDMVAEGDKVAVRWTWTGTHKGEMMGIPPTNKKVSGWAIQIDRFVGGKIVERWTREDTLGFAQQLGLVPTPKKET
jgi:steroid delta-isomerase-like uncharacterized protein